MSSILRCLVLLAVLFIGFMPAASDADGCAGDREIDALVCADPELKSLHDRLLKLVLEQMEFDMLAYYGYQFHITKRDNACRDATGRRSCLLDWYNKRVAAMPGEIEADRQARDVILNPPDVWFTPHAGIKGSFRSGWSGDANQQEIVRFDVEPLALKCTGGFAGGMFCQVAPTLKLETTIARPFNAEGTCTLEMLATTDSDPYPIRMRHNFDVDWRGEGLIARETFPFTFTPDLGYGARPVLDAKLFDYRCLITYIL